MGNLTLKKIGGICFSVLMAVGAVVGTLGFVLDWWGPVFDRDETIVNPAFATQLETALHPAPGTPRPSPTAATIRVAKEMLKTALSVPLTTDRGKALRIVATTAIAEFDYETAIEAGRSTPNTTVRAETLSFVARCAAQDGVFDRADEAADGISISTVRSDIKIELLQMRHHQDTLGISPSPGRPGWVICR